MLSCLFNFHNKHKHKLSVIGLGLSSSNDYGTLIALLDEYVQEVEATFKDIKRMDETIKLPLSPLSNEETEVRKSFAWGYRLAVEDMKAILLDKYEHKDITEE